METILSESMAQFDLDTILEKSRTSSPLVSELESEISRSGRIHQEEMNVQRILK